MKKLNFESIKNALNRDEMKKIMAGSGGSCSDYGQYCSSADHINCCSGLVCRNNKCYKATR